MEGEKRSQHPSLSSDSSGQYLRFLFLFPFLTVRRPPKRVGGEGERTKPIKIRAFLTSFPSLRKRKGKGWGIHSSSSGSVVVAPLRTLRCERKSKFEKGEKIPRQDSRSSGESFAINIYWKTWGEVRQASLLLFIPPPRPLSLRRGTVYSGWRPHSEETCRISIKRNVNGA